MRILFVAAEVAPLAKAGGMGDVVGSLPKILREFGHDVRIFMPMYGLLHGKVEVPPEPVWQGEAMSQHFSVYEALLPHSDVPLYLLKHHTFDPPRIYGGGDEHWRFTFLSNAAAEFAWNHWKPQIVHCHDWHTAMIPVWMKDTPDINSVLTIHNMAYQGPNRHFLNHSTWCPDHMQGDNVLSAGLLAAGKITTVSPNYAKEIQTPEYGERLDGLLRQLSSNLIGIVNGIDTVSFNPATDKALEVPYSINNLEDKLLSKLALQNELGLVENEDVFLMGMVARLVPQKGLDLILQMIDRFMAYTDAQFVVLGTGEHHFEAKLWEIAQRYPGRAAAKIMYDESLSRRVYAGSDVFLMPSKFEPCGISQLIAMRYGCIPIVRETGGLKDTVTFHDPIQNTGTGFSFSKYESLDLFTCLIRAWESFRYKPQWAELQRRGMTADFTWYSSAAEYIKIYRELLQQEAALTPEEQDILNCAIAKQAADGGETKTPPQIMAAEGIDQEVTAPDSNEENPIIPVEEEDAIDDSTVETELTTEVMTATPPESSPNSEDSPEQTNYELMPSPEQLLEILPSPELPVLPSTIPNNLQTTNVPTTSLTPPTPESSTATENSQGFEVLVNPETKIPMVGVSVNGESANPSNSIDSNTENQTSNLLPKPQRPQDN
jgi:starch synthase